MSAVQRPNPPGELLTRALALASMGRSVVPSTGPIKAPIGKWKQWQTMRPSVEQLYEWDRSDPERWGFVCGAISDVVVADFDGETGRKLMEEFGLRPHVKSGSGGFHVHLRHPGWPVPTMNAKAA